jgi:hypothetical protein
MCTIAAAWEKLTHQAHYLIPIYQNKSGKEATRILKCVVMKVLNPEL